MNTTYKPVDRELLEMLAAAKARGVTWMRLAEMTKKPVVELEVIPWREPKAWAKACKYAEKLLQHEALSEMLAQLRVQMNDNVNNARSKSQVANSVVRVIQLQHTLRTPKKPKKLASRPTPEPMTMPTPTASPSANEPVAMPTPVLAPKPVATTTPLATVATTVLLLVVGAFAWWPATTHHSPASSEVLACEQSPSPTPTYNAALPDQSFHVRGQLAEQPARGGVPNANSETSVRPRTINRESHPTLCSVGEDRPTEVRWPIRLRSLW